MLQIRTVLCPIGFDDLDPAEVGLAVDVCRTFGARLILLHNLCRAPLGVSMSWMWQQEHPDAGSSEETATERLRTLLARLPEGLDVEAQICDGVAAPSILQMIERTGADLVVMATHGPSTEDHSSVAEQIVDRSRCPVLVLRQGATLTAQPLQPAGGKALSSLLVATDFSASSEPAVSFAFDLARVLPLEVHLLHVARPSRHTLLDPASIGIFSGDPAESRLSYADLRLQTLVPLDLEGRVRLHTASGDPAVEIPKTAERLGTSYLVMGAHAKSFLRRLFTHDTSLELLHRSPCPVWIVPEARVA